LQVRSDGRGARERRSRAARAAAASVDCHRRQTRRLGAVHLESGIRIAMRKMIARAPWSLLLAAAAVEIAVAQAPPRQAPTPAVLQNYPAVTEAQLKKPADGDWLMVRRTYDGWGYSPLEQISKSNVARLQPVWSMSTGVTSGHQAPPIVNGGVMFVSTPQNQVLAIDVRTGALLWRYRHTTAEDAIIAHRTSRGVALLGDKVFFAAGDAILVAIDAKTGREAWTAKVADNKSGYYMSLAPLVANGKVLVGTSGGEWGVRGFVAAFDANTGKELWRTYTVPAPGEPGSETWPKGGEHYKNGGG